MSRRKTDQTTREVPPAALEGIVLAEPASPATEQDEAANGEALIPQLIPIDQLDPNPFNPRHTVDEEALKELVHSMQQHGFLGALEGRTVDGRVQLAYGARRLAAAQKARIPAIQVIVHPDWDDHKLREVALVENLQRQDLSPVEEAEALAVLIEQHGYTHAEAGKVIGKSQGYVTQKLAYLHSHDAVRQALAEGEISPTHARDLIVIPVEYQPTVLQAIKPLTTRKAQNLIQAVAGVLDDPTWWAIPQEQAEQFDFVEQHLAELIPWCYGRFKDPVQWLINLRDQGKLKRLPELVKMARQGYEARNILTRPVHEAWPIFVRDQHPDWVCEKCAFCGHRHLAHKLATSYRDNCSEKAGTCILYNDGTVPLPVDTWESNHVAPDDPRYQRTAGGGRAALSLEAIEALAVERKAHQESSAANERRKRAGATQAIVAQYQDLLAIADLSHPLAQPCQGCLHHKVDATEPGQACEYGIEGVDAYNQLEIRVWTRASNRLVPRCNRFEYKSALVVPVTPFPAAAEPLTRLMAEHVLGRYSQNASFGEHGSVGYLIKEFKGGMELVRRIPFERLITLVFEELFRQKLHTGSYYNRRENPKGILLDPTDGQSHEWHSCPYPMPEPAAETAPQDNARGEEEENEEHEEGEEGEEGESYIERLRAEFGEESPETTEGPLAGEETVPPTVTSLTTS